MIVVLDRQAPLRARTASPVPAAGGRSVVLGLAAPPARFDESPWPKWLSSYDNASKSVARAAHRRSRRSD